MTDLEDYRKELDALDRELVALFEKRMQLSQSIGITSGPTICPFLMKAGSSV